LLTPTFSMKSIFRRNWRSWLATCSGVR
jgi:hypothetical protein